MPVAGVESPSPSGIACGFWVSSMRTGFVTAFGSRTSGRSASHTSRSTSQRTLRVRSRRGNRSAGSSRARVQPRRCEGGHDEEGSQGRPRLRCVAGGVLGLRRPFRGSWPPPTSPRGRAEKIRAFARRRPSSSSKRARAACSLAIPGIGPGASTARLQVPVPCRVLELVSGSGAGRSARGGGFDTGKKSPVIWKPTPMSGNACDTRSEPPVRLGFCNHH